MDETPVVTSASLGVTPPLSTAPPTPHEMQRSLLLEATLNGLGVYESAEAGAHRQRVLARLDRIVQQWARDALESLHLCLDDGATSTTSAARLFTYGSYRLGAHGAGADIDTLIVGCRWLSRETHFFGALASLLEQRSDVTRLLKVTDAYVPVLKLTMDNVELDLVYARVNRAAVPPDLCADDSLLQGTDEQSVRSLNGVRVTDGIIQLVPDARSFLVVLRCVKEWARRRGIYSNTLGYLGGVAWALLVARACQLYPRACSAVLLQRFFALFAQWHWPTPVSLTPHTSVEPCVGIAAADAGAMALRQWDVRLFRSDAAHVMPILTPVYPRQNSAYNVSRSTLSVMRRELADAQRKSEASLKEEGGVPWDVLFVPPVAFFALYKRFVRVDFVTTRRPPSDVAAVATTAASLEDAHAAWVGWGESRLRFLTAHLEETHGVDGVQPYPRAYVVGGDSAQPRVDARITSSYYVGLHFAPSLTRGGSKAAVDISPAVEAFRQRVMERVAAAAAAAAAADHVAAAASGGSALEHRCGVWVPRRDELPSQ